MSHLEDGTLHALADGEVPSAEFATIRAHLDACAECRSRLDLARHLAADARALVDLIEVPALEGTAEDVGAGAPASPPRGGAGRPHPWPGRALAGLAWAATLVLAVGIGRYSARQGGPPAGATQRVAPAERGALADSVPRGAPEPQSSTLAEQSLESRRTAPREPAPTSPPAAAPSEQDAAARVRDVQRDAPSSPRVANAPAPSRFTEPAAPALHLERQEAAPSAALTRQRATAGVSAEKAASAGAFEEITALEAIQRLGGQLRLVDGLVPERLLADAGVVRVVYRLPDGALVLQQQRAGGEITVSLTGPSHWSPDSLARVRARIR